MAGFLGEISNNLGCYKFKIPHFGRFEVEPSLDVWPRCVSDILVELEICLHLSFSFSRPSKETVKLKLFYLFSWSEMLRGTEQT